MRRIESNLAEAMPENFEEAIALLDFVISIAGHTGWSGQREVAVLKNAGAA